MDLPPIWYPSNMNLVFMGGIDGEYVINLVNGIRKPIVTTFHTLSDELNPNRKRIVEYLFTKSKIVVVLTEYDRDLVTTKFGVPISKIRVIRHGIPSVDFVYPESTSLRKELNSPLVFVSAGHLRPTKGYELALRALARFKKNDPNFKYILLGTNQSHVNKGGSEYRFELRDLIQELNLDEQVIWIDRFLDLGELLEYILAADIGLTTYTRPSQSSSGILPLILGCGRIAVSTPFNYANSIEKQIEGLWLAEMNNPQSVYEQICKIIQRQKEMRRLMKANYQATRNWIWEVAAARYQEVYSELIE